MKRSRRILPAAAVAAAVLIAVSAAAMAAMPDNKTAGRESEAIALINNELAAAINDGGRAKAVKDDAVYENMLKSELITAKTDEYLYMFDNTSGELKAIMLIGDKAEKTTPLTSEGEAINAARAAANAALPAVDTEKYDVRCRTTAQRYSIELLEKLSDDLYGGRKIAVTFDKNGTLETFSCVNNGVGAWKTNAEKAISLEKATELAYAAINAWDGNADDKEMTEAATKTGNDVIISDSGTVGADDGEAKASAAAASIKRESGHKISAYKEARDDGIIWRIEIANVDIGNGFDVTYFVTLNALTGETLDLDMTR